MSIDSPRLVTVLFHEDPRTFIASLLDELEAAMPGLAVHYHHAEHGIEVMRNGGGRNQLSYRLRHEGTFLVKGNRAYFQVGGAVVYDSDPESEYQETLDKAQALIEALNIETEEGPSRRDNHN